MPAVRPGAIGPAQHSLRADADHVRGRVVIVRREGRFAADAERRGAAREHHRGAEHLAARIAATEQIVFDFFTDQNVSFGILP